MARDAGANPIEDTGVTVDAGGLDATVSATPLMRLRSNLALGMGYGSFTDPRREGGDRKATMSFRKA